MPRTQGRHRRPLDPAVTSPAVAVTAAARPARRRPSRLAVGTAGGTGAVALAVALVTVAAGPARNGDPTHRHDPLAGPGTTAPMAAGAPGASPGDGGPAAAGAAVPIPALDVVQTTALPVRPSTAPPMATAAPAASPTPTKPGQRRGQSHHPATPTPTPTPTSTTIPPSSLLAGTLPTLP